MAGVIWSGGGGEESYRTSFGFFGGEKEKGKGKETGKVDDRTRETRLWFIVSGEKGYRKGGNREELCCWGGEEEEE